MLSLLQNAQGTTRSFQKAKPFTLHCSLLLLVLLYAFLGGLIFNKLEAEALVRQQNDEYDERRNCVVEVSRPFLIIYQLPCHIFLSIVQELAY